MTEPNIKLFYCQK